MLTSEQRNLVEDNISLVRFTINKYFSMYAHDEDIYQIGCMALMRSTTSFEPSRGKFSTYACSCIYTDIIKHFRSLNTNKRLVNSIAVSIDSSINESDNDICFKDLIVATTNIEEECIEQLLYEEIIDAINALPEIQQRIMRLYYIDAMMQIEIAKELDTNQTQVSRYLKKSINIIRQQFNVA